VKMILTCGTQVSVRGREKEGTVSGRRLVGRGPDRVQLGLGSGVGPVGQFSLFFYSGSFSFCFLFCFISFANIIQIKPNQILNSSNIPCNIPNQ
jgi:hypothetical protein